MLSPDRFDSRRQALGLSVVIVGATVVTSLAAFSNPGADEDLNRLLTGWTWLDELAWVEDLDMWIVAATIAAVVAMGWRCRALLLGGAATTAVAYMLGTGLAVLVERHRPVGSLVAGTDSYPSLRLLVLVTMGGLVATAAHAATWPWWVRRLVTGVLAVMIGAVAMAEVHGGQRWPFDVLGSVLIGAGLVLGLRILLARPTWHRRCRGCAWGQLGAGAPGEEPAVEVDSGRAALLHRATLGWVAVLILGYAVVGLRRGLPRSPQSGVMGSGLEVPLQWALLGLMVVGVLVARRWHATGAVVVASAAGLLGYASSVQYPPLIGLVIAAVAWAPALMLWLEWHRRASIRSALFVAAVTALALGAVVGAGALTYASLAGPTHPSSPTPTPDTDVVEWMWAGGVTSSGMEVRLRTPDEASRVRLVVALEEDLAAPVVTPEAEVDGDRVAAVRVTGLQPDTRYYYAAEVDGELERGRVQSVRTFPVGQASFDFVVGSCQIGGSNGLVFDAMQATTPLFALATGDWTYSNIEENDERRFEAQYDLNLTSPAQAALYATTPIAYVWGDHDYGGNDADRTSPSRPAAMSSYRHLTPHYPLAEEAEAPIYQAFTVGRVRFLLTDTRSARDPVGDHAVGFRSTLGTEQREWLLRELGDSDRYGLVVWVNPDPWVAPASSTADTWGGFAEERQVIADAIASAEVDNLLMLSGDAHMLAFDDGTHTDYSTRGDGGFPLFHAAAVDRPGSVKGGPYTGPVIPGGGQFGGVEVHDDGSRIQVTLTGWNWNKEQLFTQVLQFPRPQS